MGALIGLHLRIGVTVSVTLLMLAVGPVCAQPSTIEGRVLQLGLGSIAANGVVVFHSADATEAAAFFARELDAALAWYAEELGWHGTIRAAVLNAADYRLVTPLPYPSPHTESATNFIVLADRANSHPGFELWDLDSEVVSAAWAFHEVGHVIARDLNVVSGNLWINELIANVIMAGYIRAERPDLMGYQSGMPSRFANANTYSRLSEFDELYFQMGQLDYLWFHFHLAAIADFLVAGPGGLAGAMVSYLDNRLATLLSTHERKMLNLR